MSNPFGRTNDLPYFVRNEGTARRYPHHIALSGGRLRYRVTRGDWVGGYKDAVLRRELFAWLYVGKLRAGAFRLGSYDLAGCGDTEEFSTLMDFDSGDEAQLGAAMGEEFPDLLDRCLLCPIIHFAHAWIDPRVSDARLFGAAANSLIEAFEPMAVLLALKAYPFELDPGSRRFLMRRKAMQRYYARVLGVRACQHQYGRDGWMYRWLEDP